MRYHHTQHAPLYLLLIVVGAIMLASAWTIPSLPPQLILIGSGFLMLLLAFSFKQLTVSDERDHLLIQFGPLPLFRRRVAYSDIERAVRTRSTLLDGWGIHLSPSGGWTWNLWTYDCVDVHLRGGRKLRIGTDDPEGLENFLTRRMAQQS